MILKRALPALVAAGWAALGALPAGAAPPSDASGAASDTAAIAPASSPATPLTLPEAVRRALEFFPTVRASQAEVDEARAGASEAESAWWPDLKLTGSATRFQKPMAVYPIHAFTPGAFPPFSRDIYSAQLTLGYTLFDGTGRVSRVRGAGRRAEAARAALAGSESELTAQVAAKYLEILSRRETLAAHDRRLDALRSERDRVEKFMAAGRAARVEELRVQAAVASAEAQRVTLAAGLALSERDLSGLTGLPIDSTRAARLTGLALADSVVTPEPEAVQLALARNADVREAERRAAAAGADVSASKSARLPELRLTGSYQAWSDGNGGDSGEWNAGLQLTQPLFTGGEITSRVRKSSARSRGAGEALRLARIQTARAAVQAHDAVIEAHARVRSLTAAEARYGEVARIEKLSLDAGSGIQTDFLSAEADLLTARAALAEARRAEITARVELARITGTLDMNWLTRNLETEP